MAAGQSPASSPRLPSPPPMAEDQLGPISPGVSSFDEGLAGISNQDTGASRRIRPGTKAEDMAEGPPLVELHEIDSAFPLTEHLKALHYAQTYQADSHTTSPITADIAKLLAIPPPNTSKDIWLYELGRFLIQKTNSIIVGLFADAPPCSSQTCPEMRASEWQYLCAVHDPPKSCSAVDYCCHTLDWAATTLTSSKMFPSRLGLGSGSGGFAAGGPDKVLQQQMKELTNIFRRVYRIYAHAWFQHREMFWRVEAKTGLYVFFKTVCDVYGLIQPENYTIPPEAEGLDGAVDDLQRRLDATSIAPIVLKRDTSEVVTPQAMQPPSNDHLVDGSETTKRHRHTKSDHVKSVTTVIQEEAEEEEEGSSKPPLDRKPTVLKAGDSDSPVNTENPQPIDAPQEVEAATSLPVPHAVDLPTSDDVDVTIIPIEHSEPEVKQEIIETEGNLVAIVTEVEAPAPDALEAHTAAEAEPSSAAKVEVIGQEATG